MQVGELIERFSDVKADSKSGSSNIAVLKKALSHVVADCRCVLRAQGSSRQPGRTSQPASSPSGGSTVRQGPLFVASTAGS
jgi:hypothetical protein